MEFGGWLLWWVLKRGDISNLVVLVLVLLMLLLLVMFILSILRISTLWNLAAVGIVGGMRFSRGYELEQFEGVGILCAGSCYAEVVASWERDAFRFEAQNTIDLDSKTFV